MMGHYSSHCDTNDGALFLPLTPITLADLCSSMVLLQPAYMVAAAPLHGTLTGTAPPP
ncbi:unnamed protein product, partial [Staurois parvus]